MHDTEIISFLQKTEIQYQDITYLKSDASFRHYARIRTQDKTYILMMSPQSEKPHEFNMIDQLLRKNGLHAPKIYASDLDKGLILMEDFGDNLYAKHLKYPQNDEMTLYKRAIDALIKIASIKTTDKIPMYDLPHIMAGLQIFWDWFIPNTPIKNIPQSEKDRFTLIWTDLFHRWQNAPMGLMLMDYQTYNIMWLGDEKGLDQCGLLDFQDARVGPLGYDLASLIEDARRDFPLTINQRNELLNYYLSKMNLTNPDLFLESYHMTSVKRLIRCIGIFCRLSIRDGKNQYLKYIPMLWDLVDDNINQPYFNDFKAWLDKNIPVEFRAIPPCLREKA